MTKGAVTDKKICKSSFSVLRNWGSRGTILFKDRDPISNRVQLLKGYLHVI